MDKSPLILEVPGISPLDSLHADLLYRVHEVSRTVSKMFDHLMASQNVTHAQWWALMHLSHNEGCTQSEFAEISQTGRASAGKLLERMEKKGWIDRRVDPGDARVRRIYLTRAALPILATMTEQAMHQFRALLFDVDENECKAVIDCLIRIAQRADEANV